MYTQYNNAHDKWYDIDDYYSSEKRKSHIK